MAKCIICKSKKAQRNCPGISGEICSKCCGLERNKKVSCLQNCMHLSHSNAYFLEKEKSREIFNFDREMMSIIGDEEKHLDLLNSIETGIFLAYSDSNQEICDEDARVAVKFIFETEKQNLGFPAQIPYLSEAQDTIVSEIESIFDVLNRKIKQVARMDKLKCLFRVLASIENHSRSQQPQNYLHWISNYLKDKDGKVRNILVNKNGKMSALRLCLKVTTGIRDKNLSGGVPENVLGQIVEFYSLSKRKEISSADYKVQLLRLENWLSEFPGNPFLLYLVEGIYRKLRMNNEADEVLIKNNGLNPGYPLARTSYALHLLNNQEFEGIPSIFGGKWELENIFPERDSFNLVEVGEFLGFVTMYFATIKEAEKAQKYLETLEEIDPDNSRIEFLREFLEDRLLWV